MSAISPLQDNQVHLAELVRQLSDITTRLGGDWPTTDRKENPPLCRGGIIGRIDTVGNYYRISIDELRDLVDRLEALV